MSDLLLLSKIVSIAEIKTLDLSSTLVFAGLSNFKFLEHLSISNSSLRSLPSELPQLKSLKTLSIPQNEIRDFSLVPKSVKSLNLSSNNLSKLLLTNLNKLVELDISHNRIQGLEGLSHLKHLKYLYCNSNLITSLHPLNDLEIAELNVSDNLIKSIECLRPVINSLQIVQIKDNPCCKLGNFSVFLHNFRHHDNFLFSRTNLEISNSKLLKSFVKTNCITLRKSESVNKAMKQLDQVKEKNKNLDKKIKKLEKIIMLGEEEPIGEKRIFEIEMMSYEDWRSGLFRYATLKVLHAKRIKQLNYYKDSRPIKEHKIRFLQEKGRNFSMEQEKIAVKMKKLFENL